MVKNKLTWRTVEDEDESNGEDIKSYPIDKPDFKIALNP